MMKGINKMLKKDIINGEEYYCHYIDGNVGDLFTDWRDIPRYRAKLINQIKKTNEIIQSRLCGVKK